MSPRWSLCSYNDLFTTQWPERAAQNAHFSLCPLTVDILVIPHPSQDENVNLVTWPVSIYMVQTLHSLPAPSHTVCSLICVPLAPGTPPTKLSPDSRPLHNLFPLPGATTAYFVEFSAHVPLPQRSVPCPLPPHEATFPILFTGCAESLCRCSYDSCSFSALCDYFFVSLVRQLALQVRNCV